MSTSVLGWWMYMLTNSKLALGFLGLSEVIPALSLALFAGHYIDHHEKKKTLIKCLVGYIACIGAFAFLSSAFIEKEYHHWVIATGICLVLGFTGAIRAFSGPTMSAMLPGIVGKELLSKAVPMSSGSFLVASIFGHAIGGFMIAWMGIHYTFFVIMLVVFIGLLVMLQLNTQPLFVNYREKPTWSSLMEGLKYVYKTKELLGAMALDMFAVLFGGAVAMVPVFARDILKVGPVGFGWLNAAADIGAITIVLILSIWPVRKQQGRKLFFVVAGFGICIIVFALSRSFWLSFFALICSGLLDGISMVIRGTILQLKTPDELRGRVMSVSTMFISSSNELGQFESGVAAKLLGTVPSLIFGGCMTVAVAVTTWFKAPALRKMEY